jgi:protein-tyrosine-phosphatase
LTNVLLVCHANTCRSVMAHVLLEKMLDARGVNGNVRVRSGGIANHARDGMIPSLDARIVLREDDIHLAEDAFASTDLRRHRDIVAAADLIVTMTAQQKETIGAYAEAQGRPVLTLHECEPGHSFQAALSVEQKTLPRFRQNLYFSGYGEGWGLYCEWLGNEMGIYRTPYERFGQQSYAMWRAARLVIDTGIHRYGWSRHQAVDYLAGHTALSQHEVETEVDRYISWPGQALSYKLGELKIRELRERAQARLGNRFDLRAFHDAVLAQGSLPLTVLEGQIDQWIERRQRG